MASRTRDGILRGGIAALVRLLILAAAGISGYLLSVSLSGGQAVGCNPGSGCDAVLQSRWAYVFNIPVSAPALVVDLALLVTTLTCGPKSTAAQRRGAWEILFPGSVLVLGAALWFIALQAFVLQRFCPWCMTAHICGALAAILLLTRVPVTGATERREKDPGVAQPALIRFAIAALCAVAFLGVAQTFGPRKTFSVTTISSGTSNALAQVVTPATTNLATMPTNKSVPTAAMVQSNAPAVPTATVPLPAKTFDVLGGRVRFDLAQVPLWGSPDAPFKMVSLFDYTCHHCQEMHERVAMVQRSFGNQLAVVSLPMPLDAKCNPILTRGTPAAHTNACIYARLGLAVWRAKREALIPFDDWLFASPTWRLPVQRPPPLAEVTNKAVELVGATAFENACRDPWIDLQIQADIQLYTNSFNVFRKGDLPQFIINTNLFAGPGPTGALRAVVVKSFDTLK